jgi:hypothetical protein
VGEREHGQAAHADRGGRPDDRAHHLPQRLEPTRGAEGDAGARAEEDRQRDGTAERQARDRRPRSGQERKREKAGRERVRNARPQLPATTERVRGRSRGECGEADPTRLARRLQQVEDRSGGEHSRDDRGDDQELQRALDRDAGAEVDHGRAGYFRAVMLL